MSEVFTVGDRIVFAADPAIRGTIVSTRHTLDRGGTTARAVLVRWDPTRQFPDDSYDLEAAHESLMLPELLRHLGVIERLAELDPRAETGEG